MTPGKVIPTRAAFSLVEVTMAIGLVAFCILALVGMVPVGLNSLKSAQEESGAATCLEQLSFAISSASKNGSGQYQASAPYSTLSWTAANTLTNLSLGGMPTDNKSDQRLAARVEIKTMPTATSSGTALISVAWPARSKWSTTANNWTNAAGSVSTWLIFLPRK